ncbi:MAG: phosphoenolpyruvate--protein phosphotransferase [Planctomycetota bacterium]
MPDLLLLHDIARLIGESRTLQEILDGVVGLVADRMEADVCSIYLLDDDGEALTLAATRGLKPEAVGQARLARGEGVTWQILKRMRPLMAADITQEEHFAYLPEVGEENLKALLGVPLRVRGAPIGTLAVQSRSARVFTRDEERALAAIASQVAPVVENARLFREGSTASPETLRHDEGADIRRAQGTSCSVGVAAGPVRRLDVEPPPPPPVSVDEEAERTRLEVAILRARRELQDMQQWLRDRHADEAALVFSVHLMLLDDSNFRERLDEALGTPVDAVTAVQEVRAGLIEQFDAMTDPYLRERGTDVADLADRLVRHLEQRRTEKPRSVRGSVAVIHDITPSRLVTLSAEGAVAVLAGGGSATSHAALLARSLDLPLVVGLGDFVKTVEDGERVLVDAASGEVVVDPPDRLIDETLRAATALADAMHRYAREHSADTGRIRYESNVSLWGDAVRAQQYEASGIGLYRTEFAFLMRPDLPSEEEQTELYRRVVDEVQPLPVTFRLLDAGGDKIVPALGLTREPNPFLGYRSTRLLLDHPDVLRGQVRAILEALGDREGRVLVPMVASVEEFRAVRCLLEDADLQPAQLGAMVELPSTLMGIEELAREADFISIGTNDLTQHLLGVDRTNARVMRFFDFCHPSLLRAITMTAAAVQNQGRELCVCGEMASNPLFLPVWVALGVTRLSVHARRIPALRALEARFDRDETEAWVKEILAMESSVDVRARLESVAAPEVVDYLQGSTRV